jgi:hypothetical protein
VVKTIDVHRTAFEGRGGGPSGSTHATKLHFKSIDGVIADTGGPGTFPTHRQGSGRFGAADKFGARRGRGALHGGELNSGFVGLRNGGVELLKLFVAVGHGGFDGRVLSLGQVWQQKQEWHKQGRTMVSESVVVGRGGLDHSVERVVNWSGCCLVSPRSSGKRLCWL